MRTPSIFEFATSELSQDAMFAWLLRWADNQFMVNDPELCRLGKAFVALLTGIEADKVYSIVVKRQKLHTDLLVKINENIYLIVEDKVSSSIHDNQLNRYSKAIEEEYHDKSDNILKAYVKTHNESLCVLAEVKEYGYRPVGRDAVLSVLNQYVGTHPLVIDFREHLQDITNWTNNRLTWPVSKWEWFEWQGFYMDLEQRLEGGKWHYVPNPSKGFLCFWWHNVSLGDAFLKLQFEHKKKILCFKLYCEHEADYSVLRRRYSKRLLDLAKERFPEIHKPNRFGNGANMTIGFVDSASLFGTGQVDLETVICKLHLYEKLVDKMAYH